VVWKILDIGREFESGGHQLHQRMNQEDQLVLVLADSEDPKLDAVEELPRVERLH
jgi:regulator of sigma D